MLTWGNFYGNYRIINKAVLEGFRERQPNGVPERSTELRQAQLPRLRPERSTERSRPSLVEKSRRSLVEGRGLNPIILDRTSSTY